MTEGKKYQVKRGDIVYGAGREQMGVVAGWINEDDVCILDLEEKKVFTYDESDITLVVKAEKLEELLPKQVELSPLHPKEKT